MHAGTSGQDGINGRYFSMAILGATLLFTAACAEQNINPQTLCPASGSERQTILLIDTTDPLTLTAQERLKQLLKAFLDAGNQHYLQPAHELIVYRLLPRVAAMEKPLRVCNPGNPDDRTWEDNLVSGKYGELRKWRHFGQRILRALPRLDEQLVKGHSPVLESIAFVTARHIPNIGVGEKRKPTQLILFSDMLQHSERLSHYKTLPTMDEFSQLTGYVEMQSDLTDTDIWLFYVRRSGLENKQTPEHYYWWTQVMDSFGGRLQEQVPL